MYPESIEKLIECFKILPSVGNKTAERYALSCLDINDEILNLFADSFANIKEKIGRCKICNKILLQQSLEKSKLQKKKSNN